VLLISALSAFLSGLFTLIKFALYATEEVFIYNKRARQMQKCELCCFLFVPLVRPFDVLPCVVAIDNDMAAAVQLRSHREARRDPSRPVAEAEAKATRVPARARTVESTSLQAATGAQQPPAESPASVDSRSPALPPVASAGDVESHPTPPPPPASEDE
jgi:hypothetical protein